MKPSAVFATRQHLSAAFFIHTSTGGALSVLLYFLVILLGVIFLGTQIASIFSYQTISKLSYNLFVLVERFGKISLTIVPSVWGCCFNSPVILLFNL